VFVNGNCQCEGNRQHRIHAEPWDTPLPPQPLMLRNSVAFVIITLATAISIFGAYVATRH
jgi:hypothetical protein